MRLENLKIRRFKSLYDIDLDFSQFRVLTGPNGSGKSNLVDAIGFLGEAYRFGIDYAVGRAGGIDSIAFRKARRTTIGVQFTVKASLELGELQAARLRRNPLPQGYPLEVEHSFTIKPGSGQNGFDYAVAEEKFSVHVNFENERISIIKVRTAADSEPEMDLISPEGLPPVIDEICRITIGILWRERVRGVQEELFTVPMTQGAVSLDDMNYSIPVFREFKHRMSFIQAYRLNPTACRKPGVLTPNAALESDGSNLPAVVARTASKQPATWQRVMSGMRQIMTNLENISTEPSPDSGLILRFHESGSGRPWSAREVSDGTIQALALLLALHDRRRPIVLIEEPENAIHPWVLRRILENCREVNDRQIVLTTHSPILLKLLRPEEVVILWRTNGKSHIKNLLKVSPEIKELYYEKGFDVFDIYDSGLIPQSLPGNNSGE